MANKKSLKIKEIKLTINFLIFKLELNYRTGCITPSICHYNIKKMKMKLKVKIKKTLDKITHLSYNISIRRWKK